MFDKDGEHEKLLGKICRRRLYVAVVVTRGLSPTLMLISSLLRLGYINYLKLDDGIASPNRIRGASLDFLCAVWM